MGCCHGKINTSSPSYSYERLLPHSNYRDYKSDLIKSGLLTAIHEASSPVINFSLIVKTSSKYGTHFDHQQSFYEDLYQLLQPIEKASGQIIISTRPIVRGEEYRVIHVNSDEGTKGKGQGKNKSNGTMIVYIKIKPDMTQQPILSYQY